MMPTASRVVRSVRTRWHNLGRDQSGSILTFVVFLPVLAGAVAIGVETGQLYRIKRQMQTTADAAALAGTIDSMAAKSADTIIATAKYEAQRNGFTDGMNSVTVAVNTNTGTLNAVEVTITKTTGFSIGAVLLNGSLASFDVKARSVAAPGTYTVSSTTTSSASNGEACMLALSPNSEQGVSFTSFNNFTSDCTIMSNTTATGTGTNASVRMSAFNTATLTSVWTRGSFDATAYNHLTLTDNGGAARVNQTGSVFDTYASLPTPTPPACNYTNYSAPPGSSVTLFPGTYCGGLTASSNSNVYFKPGTYYITNGDLIIRSDNNVSCPDCVVNATGTTTGTTFVLTQTSGNNADIGGVSITSQNNVALNAPYSGTYAGVLFYQDRRVAAGTMSSSSKIFTVASLNNATLSGAIYFPQNRIDISSINNFGGSSSTGCTVWIGRYLKFSSFNNNYKAGCKTYYNTDTPGLTTTVTVPTTTTVTKAKVVE
jgi:Flp pilus assembly protein TadG